MPATVIHRGKRLWLAAVLVATIGLLVLAMPGTWRCQAPGEPFIECPRHLSPGQPFQVVLTCHSLLPPARPQALTITDQRLAVAYDSSVRPSFTLREGLHWHHYLTLIPVSDGLIPPSRLQVDEQTVDLPELTVAAPEVLSDTPLFSPATEASFGSLRQHQFFLVIIVGFIVLTLLNGFLQRHLHHSPADKIKHLPCLPSSLDKLPKILAQNDINPRNSPEFFSQLDQARFSGTPPASATIQELLDAAAALVQR